MVRDEAGGATIPRVAGQPREVRRDDPVQRNRQREGAHERAAGEAGVGRRLLVVEAVDVRPDQAGGAVDSAMARGDDEAVVGEDVEGDVPLDKRGRRRAWPSGPSPRPRPGRSEPRSAGSRRSPPWPRTAGRHTFPGCLYTSGGGRRRCRSPSDPAGSWSSRRSKHRGSRRRASSGRGRRYTPCGYLLPPPLSANDLSESR